MDHTHSGNARAMDGRETVARIGSVRSDAGDGWSCGRRRGRCGTRDGGGGGGGGGDAATGGRADDARDAKAWSRGGNDRTGRDGCRRRRRRRRARYDGDDDVVSTLADVVVGSAGSTGERGLGDEDDEDDGVRTVLRDAVGRRVR